MFILKPKWILIFSSFQLHLYVAPWDSGNFHNFLHLQIIAHRAAFPVGKKKMRRTVIQWQDEAWKTKVVTECSPGSTRPGL